MRANGHVAAGRLAVKVARQHGRRSTGRLVHSRSAQLRERAHRWWLVAPPAPQRVPGGALGDPDEVHFIVDDGTKDPSLTCAVNSLDVGK